MGSSECGMGLGECGSGVVLGLCRDGLGNFNREWTPMGANIWRGGIGFDHEALDFELIKRRLRGTLIRAHSCSFAVLSSRPEGERK